MKTQIMLNKWNLKEKMTIVGNEIKREKEKNWVSILFGGSSLSFI